MPPRRSTTGSSNAALIEIEATAQIGSDLPKMASNQPRAVLSKRFLQKSLKSSANILG